jgi:hypothetical protein
MEMGIHTRVEVQLAGGRWIRREWPYKRPGASDEQTPFDFRHDPMFGFLGSWRAPDRITPIAPPRGLPPDVSDTVARESAGPPQRIHSWLSVDELTRFDYDQPSWTDSGAHGVTYRELLPAKYFVDLVLLKELNEEQPTRVVFWFD